MLRLATDFDVHGDIIRGLRRNRPKIDLVRCIDVLPRTTPDPDILAWAASERRVLISNDRSTMTGFAKVRIEAGDELPGLILTSNLQSIGGAIKDLLMIEERFDENEMRRRITIFLPFRE